MDRDRLRRRWSDAPPAVRGAVVAVAAFDGVLKVLALRDIARREGHEIRGPKPLWIAGVTLVNLGGIAPAAWFLVGRRR